MFALMVGVVVGTYSSLFVASPVMVDTIKRKGIKE
jgi:SecD/SecF fusion protein